jgi:hypothetical protein
VWGECRGGGGGEWTKGGSRYVIEPKIKWRRNETCNYEMCKHGHKARVIQDPNVVHLRMETLRPPVRNRIYGCLCSWVRQTEFDEGVGTYMYLLCRRGSRGRKRKHPHIFKISLKFTVKFLNWKNLWNWPLILMWSALFPQMLDPPLIVGVLLCEWLYFVVVRTLTVLLIV